MPSQFRPIFHFAPPAGWCNDPNGLIFHADWWHLFYQLTPESLESGPKFWGHAVSRDLSSWQNRPIALAPDELGAIFSGSAVFDADKGAMVACFTHDAPGRQVQSLAFSSDEGLTWRKYEGNPVLTSSRADFRDPKVFRHQNEWIMIVAASFEAQIYASPDLLSWTLRSTFAAPQPDWIWECPDLIRVGERWILSGSMIRPGATLADGNGTYYWIGDFDGARFTARGEMRALSFGPDDYAAVSWSGAPDGRALIIGWMNHWHYAESTPTDAENWRGAMTLPRELSIVDGTLRQNPPPEICARRGAAIALASPFTEVSSEAYELEATLDLSQLADEAAGFRLHFGDDSARVFYDAKTRELVLDRGEAGATDFHASFVTMCCAPLELRDDKLNLRIFVDRCSVEVFAQNGLLYGAMLVFPAPGARRIELLGAGASVQSGAVHPIV